ncbi:protein takeout-like [Hyposmocoma kahamanoa]|uniref:protein takeout-like n=1 Tax=Hyposmocoma kahamanoa TaxID=1477025 RepID=UPI000E6D8199|nr:protein takeout-like [Hyposmocoma kahamanoa]
MYNQKTFNELCVLYNEMVRVLLGLPRYCSASVGGFVCPREEKALGRCLRDVLNNYIPHIATGLPEYGIPPCEPLLIPSLTVKQSAGPIHVTSSYHDVVVKGPASMRVKDVRVNAKKHQVVAKLYIPELRMKGNYKVTGQLLMLPIEGDGKFSAKYSDINAIVTIVLGRLHRELAPDALACEDLDVKFHVGQASMQLENLFGGNNELGNAMNRFLNENWQKLAEELQTPMEEALRDFLKPLGDHAFATLDADDILIS